MRRSYRFSIAALMGVVLVTAVLLAALRGSTEETWGGAMLLLTCGVLALAVVGVVCRTGSERAWWLGFALFGWGYLALAFWYGDDDSTHRLPTMVWLDAMSTRLGLSPPGPEPVRALNLMMMMRGGTMSGMLSVGVLALQRCVGAIGGAGGNAALFEDYRSYAQIGHCLWALFFAFMGGMLARFLFAIPVNRSEPACSLGEASGQHGWNRFVRPGGVGFAGLALIALLFAARSRSTPGLWAGGTFLVTCGLLGLAALGAVLDRSRRGDIWLGATLFGCGYLIVALSRTPAPYSEPYVPTDQFLIAIKSWLPRSAQGFFVSSDGVAAANARILRALDQPVPMHFAAETSLDDVLKHIAESTTRPDGKPFPIYIDPIGLSEAEKSMQSTVSLDLEGVPLRTTLYLCLRQLDLAYTIHDGVLMITSMSSLSNPSFPLRFGDPFLIGGHCLLALFAAALGGALAPLVSGRRRAAT